MATSFYFKLFCCSLTSKQRHRRKKNNTKTTKVLQMLFLTRYFFRRLCFCRLDLYHAREWLENWIKKIAPIAQNGGKSITTEKWVYILFYKVFFSFKITYLINFFYCIAVSLFGYLCSEVTRGYVLENDEERYIYRRQKMYTFMKIPRELEKFMSYGFFHCLDSFLFVFTFLPIRFLTAMVKLVFRLPLSVLRYV